MRRGVVLAGVATLILAGIGGEPVWAALASVSMSAPDAAPASSAPPRPRSPEQREALAQLSYLLGQSHALHRRCAGEADAFWYERMQRLLAVEAPDPGLRRRLVDRFNAGYVAAGAEYPQCGADSRAAERDAASRGRAAARALAEVGLDNR